MNDIETRVHNLKLEIRRAVNKARLPCSVSTAVLDSIKSEVMQIEIVNLREEIMNPPAQAPEESIAEGEFENDHTDIQPEPNS